jgi:hypothetical protein
MSEPRIVPEEVLTIDDLDRVYIRCQKDDSAEFGSVNCKEATDLQFDTWAKSRMTITGDDGPWSLEERATFCNQLYQAGELVILKKRVEVKP